MSQSLKDIALTLGAAPEKLRVMPNGVDTHLFNSSNREEVRRSLGFTPGQKIILSVGALSERKGHHRVVEVLPRILAKWPDAEYVVVGGGGAEGDTRPLIERLSQNLGVQHRVRLVGERPHEEVAMWLAAADVFCLATSNEGMANVILEALACGVPVVTTRVGGNAELVRHGENGYLVPLGDQNALANALIDASRNPWDRELIAREIRARSWNATVSRIMDEFRQICPVTEALLGRKQSTFDV